MLSLHKVFDQILLRLRIVGALWYQRNLRPFCWTFFRKEIEVYDQLRRYVWWHGMKSDVIKFALCVRLVREIAKHSNHYTCWWSFPSSCSAALTYCSRKLLHSSPYGLLHQINGPKHLLFQIKERSWKKLCVVTGFKKSCYLIMVPTSFPPLSIRSIKFLV